MIENSAVMTFGGQRITQVGVAMALVGLSFGILSSSAPAATPIRADNETLIGAGHAHGTGQEGFFLPGAICEQCPVIPLEIEQGSNVEFTGMDEEQHRVVSKAKRRGVPVFLSKGVANGDSTVMKTSHLKPGTYDFYCAFHTAMTGVLEVR